jgi:hypothetical protein
MTTNRLSAVRLNSDRQQSRVRHRLHGSSERSQQNHALTAPPIRITVVTATKNSVDTLSECLASVYRQSYVFRPV